jgi:hypothetical protein
MIGDSEVISRLMERVTWLESRSVLLDRLLFAVETKYPDESRFDTAFRYISEAESRIGITRGIRARSFAIHRSLEQKP